jgi:beta-glucosidase
MIHQEDNSLEISEKACHLAAQMTLSEKASLCSGKDLSHFKGISRLGLREEMATDGSSGLRAPDPSVQQVGLGVSLPAVCFPSASTTACSFDRGLWFEIGKAIGEAGRQENVGILNGPGINIKRSPLCGRNFEYYSEDPYLAGEAGTAFIKGVQSQGVGTALKHFAANNQEKRRMTVDAVMDERTFREIYLPAFEAAVKKARPWLVMASFNKLFGEHACEYKRMLTGILRDEWGFEGVVLSDWGAVVDRIKALKAGLDVEMPYVDETNDKHIVQAVGAGAITQEEITTAATRIIELILKCAERQTLRINVDAHRLLARRAAAESAELLKNEGNLLPGSVGQKAAVIGAFAKEPRYQGMGSSKVNPIKLESAFDALQEMGLVFEYAAGYRLDVHSPDEALIAQAVQAAEGKGIVYIFAGLPGIFEAEGVDRKNMCMPESHIALIQAVSKVNEHVVVVLQGGAPMEMKWADQVPAILLLYLGGEAGGMACADLLLGKTNPAGKLAESWPFNDNDSPSHDFFPGNSQTVEYREGLYVGYRYYDTAKKPVRYPFGFGLSYTQFQYDHLTLSKNEMGDDEILNVSCTVTNNGTRAGSEIVQLYVACRNSVIIRPAQELKGFEKVFLEPDESRNITFTLTNRDFAYYNVALRNWHVENADYEVRISASSKDIRLSGSVQVHSRVSAILPDFRKMAPGYYDLSGGIKVNDEEFACVLGHSIPPRERQKGDRYTTDSTLADIQGTLIGKLLLGMMKQQTVKLFQDDPEYLTLVDEGVRDLPLRFLAMMSGGAVSITQIEGLVELLNGHLLLGIRMILKKKVAS